MPKSVKVTTKTFTNNRKATAYSRSKAARSVAHRSARGPKASHGFTPLASWKRGKGIKGETKAVDLATATYNFTTTTSTAGVGLNFMSAGSSFFNRIGRKVAMQSLYVNGLLGAINPALAAVDEYVRMIVVYDAQTNGVAPTWAQVVQAYTQAGASSNLVTDGVNLDYRDRFRIILDKRILLPGAIVTTGAMVAPGPFPTSCELTIQEFRKLNNLETQFKADSSPGVIGDIATGGLFFLVQGSIGGQYAFTGTFRLRYTDN